MGVECKLQFGGDAAHFDGLYLPDKFRVEGFGGDEGEEGPFGVGGGENS